MGRPHHEVVMVVVAVMMQPKSHEFAGYHTGQGD
jgi:hypothetical protein